MATIVNQIIDKLTNDDKLKAKLVTPCENFISLKITPYVRSAYYAISIILAILVYIIFKLHMLSKSLNIYKSTTL